MSFDQTLQDSLGVLVNGEILEDLVIPLDLGDILDVELNCEICYKYSVVLNVKWLTPVLVGEIETVQNRRGVEQETVVFRSIVRVLLDKRKFNGFGHFGYFVVVDRSISS